MAGGCRASVSDADWDLLYRMSEERGADVRLDGEAVEDKQLVHHRPAVAELCIRQHWKSVFAFRFHCEAHVNVFELENARVNFVFRRLGGRLLQDGPHLEVVWVPTWANPADAPSRAGSACRHRACHHDHCRGRACSLGGPALAGFEECRNRRWPSGRARHGRR